MVAFHNKQTQNKALEGSLDKRALKMESKTKVKNSIELFYIKTKSKSDTYNKFKDFKIK